MRKSFEIPPCTNISRARAYIALPGVGSVWINGQKVDGRAGTRSLSQYDLRALYHTYDVQRYLKLGTNVVAAYVGLGWFGHPPLGKAYGPPTLRALIRIEMYDTNGTAGQTMSVGTDTTWLETGGPVLYDDIYNGSTYDARLETVGWTTPQHSPSGSATANWTAVLASAAQADFKLNTTILSAASFPAVEVIQSIPATSMRMPAPGVYVYDFGQNMPGWCKLSVTGPRGLNVQLRHAEVLMHPPYGPADGNVYVRNLRTAKATDLYILKGDPDGETVEFSMSQHGFRYVELTFPGSPEQEPPTISTIEVAYARSAMEQTGGLAVSNELLQQVHHNIVWGQASNLMMVPTDCDQRDERYGWTGDAAVTADEAAQNFDMGAFYQNWLRMLDDASQNGAVPCWVPGAAGWKSPRASGSCDAAWASAYPSVAYALFKWNGDVTAPQKYWTGLTRFVDNEYLKTDNSTHIENIFATWGDWCPAPGLPTQPHFEPEPRVDKAFVGGFSFVKDVGHIAEMATVIEGVAGRASVAKYTAMYAQVKAAFHKHWFNAAKQWYADGGQTAQVLALTLDSHPPFMMAPGEKAAVLARLVQNVVTLHGNHSTSGITGFRYVADVLSDNGFGDVAFAIMTHTEYPSFGYQIVNKYEPATTLWELWDSDTQYSSLHPMNSRNHAMFAGPGSWLHTYVGGITNAAGSIGYERVQFTPPAVLIRHGYHHVAFLEGLPSAAHPNHVGHSNSNSTGNYHGADRARMAAAASDPLRWGSATKQTGRGTFGLFWSLSSAANVNETCGVGNESVSVAVNCTGVGISQVIFADYGTPEGTYEPNCGNEVVKGACSTPDLLQRVSTACVGADSCVLECTARVAAGQFMGCNISAVLAGGRAKTVGIPLPDPCEGRKKVALQVQCNGPSLSIRSTAPANSVATTAVPLLGVDADDVSVSENGTVVWSNGVFVPGAVGVSAAAVSNGAILVTHGSGVYDFRRTSKLPH